MKYGFTLNLYMLSATLDIVPGSDGSDVEGVGIGIIVGVGGLGLFGLFGGVFVCCVLLFC